MAPRREESPTHSYWRDFLSEFHQAQNQQAARKTGFAASMSRAKLWFSDLGASKWAYGAGIAYAAVTIACLVPAKKVGFETTLPAPVEQEMVPARMISGPHDAGFLKQTRAAGQDL